MEDDSHTLKVIHLVQTGESHCPVCGRVMLKNGFRKKKVIVRALKIAGVPTIISIRKQKYICKPSPSCPRTVTKVARITGINTGCRDCQ